LTRQAAVRGHLRTLRIFISRAASKSKIQLRKLLEAKDSKAGCTMLILACANNQTQIVQFLLSMQPLAANIEATNNDGITALMWSSMDGRDSIVKYLLTLPQPPKIQTRSKDGDTLLHLAAMNGHAETIKLILSLIPASERAILNFVNNDGDSLLRMGSWRLRV
jgi:ankyrin repeat protein